MQPRQKQSKQIYATKGKKPKRIYITKAKTVKIDLCYQGKKNRSMQTRQKNVKTISSGCASLSSYAEVQGFNFRIRSFHKKNV
jgi:hypothetical protein